jgi:tryptophan synthase alpha chain
LKRDGKKAFIAYITAGDPDIRVTERLVKALKETGVDIIELGIPFSDPIADGPTIQAASQRALKNKITLRKIFAMAGRLKDIQMPLVFMTYYNPVMRYSLQRFFASCRRYGIDGVIIPDMPVEEGSELSRIGKKYDVATIFLVSPTSTRDRVRKIAAKSRGFIYYVSLTGVTGARRRLPPEVVSNVRAIKRVTGKPVAVGFGISDSSQAHRIARFADGVIVGSAIVDIIGRNGNNRARILREVPRFTKKIAKAIHSA